MSLSMPVKEVEAAIAAYNKTVDGPRRFRFRVIEDNSLLHPRIKTCHNILVNNTFLVIATTSALYRWTLQDKNHTVLFKGSLAQCLEQARKLQTKKGNDKNE